MNIMFTTQSSWKPCNKCGKNNYKPANENCEDCKPIFRKRKCYKHTFSILNMTLDRTIKCSVVDCNELRKA